MKATITIKALRAVSLAMAKKDVRYYLNGVFIENTGTPWLVATDGARLHAFTGFGVEGEGHFIMPDTMVSAILKAAGPDKKRGPENTVTLEHDEFTITATVDGTTLTGTAIDGRFPEWQRAVPKTITNEPGNYNPLLLVGFSKAARIFGVSGSLVAVAQNGAGPALVSIRGVHNFFGVLMPCHTDEGPTNNPAYGRAIA